VRLLLWDLDSAGCNVTCVRRGVNWRRLAIAIESGCILAAEVYLTAFFGINLILVRKILFFEKRNITGCTRATHALADLRACWQHAPRSLLFIVICTIFGTDSKIKSTIR